jgi:hypothetical protein
MALKKFMDKATTWQPPYMKKKDKKTGETLYNPLFPNQTGVFQSPAEQVSSPAVRSGSGGLQEPISDAERTKIAQANPNQVIDQFGNVVGKEQQQREFASIGGIGAKEAREQRIRAEQEGQMLAGQVGQFDQLALSDDPLFDVGQGITQGLIDFIPRAITSVGALSLLRGSGAVGAVGAVGGVARGSRALGTNPRALGTNPRALAAGGTGVAGAAGAGAGVLGVLGGLNPYVAGAAVIAGLASSMISEFGAQRRDTIAAQKQTLTDGKQVLNDFVNLAKTDPVNKAYYLAQYNKASAQIDAAYRQMKYDTSRDLTKFETAVPELAEFEDFYNMGEKQKLDDEMRMALAGGTVPPEYAMLDLVNRRL